MPRQVVTGKGHDRNRSLGWLAVAWMEFLVVHGPGDVQGEPVRHGDEYTGFIVDCYALGVDGRRLYDSVFLSRPKGCDKSGLAARLSLFEALGPCRFAGWASGGETYRDPWGLGFTYTYQAGEPMGRPVKVPFIRCMATEEEQTGNVYDSIHYNLTEGPLARAMARRDDAGLTRILLPGGGEITPSTASSAAKDGGKETFCPFDEALALDTPLPTPTGWTTMGEVQIGDELIGGDGAPVTVVKATEVQTGRRCYRVNFADGSSIVASDGHLWETRVVGSAAKPRIRTTGEIVTDGRRMAVPPTPISAGVEADLPIAPYILGAWLGDGDSRNATISTSAEDYETTTRAIESRGYTVKRCAVAVGRAECLYVSVSGSHRNRWSPVDGLKVRLRAAGLLLNKHIPPAYLTGSVDQRSELLRGLMDTDGSVSPRGHCTFASANPRLIADVKALLVSLGQRVGEGWQHDPRSRTGRTGRLWFTPRWGLRPFAMPRKAALVKVTGVPRMWNTITGITEVDSVDVRCVAVDSEDHLFLAGEARAVTHNTHLYDRPELRRMYAVVARNLRKRKKVAETWYIETTTMYQPGAQSVAEETYKLAELIREGKTKRDRLLLDHRWGELDPADLGEEKLLAAALVDSYGDALAWNHLPGLIDQVLDPRADVADSIRYFLNDRSSAENAWIAAYEWSARVDATKVVSDRDVITLGFDGSRKRARGVTDATALVGCRVSDGHVFEIEIWEQPKGATGRDWTVPTADVLAAVDQAFKKYTVAGFYADPAKWESHVANWEAKYGSRLKVKATREHPVEWWMTGGRAIYTVRALEKFRSAVIDGEMTNDGASTLARHILAARMVHTRSGVQIAKEHPQSDRKIDAAVAAVLAWQARLDALAAGVGGHTKRRAPSRIR